MRRISLNTLSDAIDRARANAQDLHKRVTALTAEDRAAAKTDFENLAVDAQQLAAALKTAAQGQQPNTRQYLDDAVALLQDAANHARDAAKVAKPEFDRARAAVVADITDSIQLVSRAVATKRSAEHSAGK
jgi:uncharacterized phage infection (PIP) family protein YhgE